MKTLSIISFTIFSLVVFITVGVSFAEEREMVIEMADGNLVALPMTAEEIAAEDAAKAELKRRKSAGFVKAKKRVKAFEMGESGHYVSFPLTDEEIANEDASNVRLEALRDANAHNPKARVVNIEMAESGNFISFPLGQDKKDIEIRHKYSQRSQ